MTWVNLARYAFNRKEFRTTPPPPVAKRKLFEPTNKGETSVACTDGLNLDGVISLGKDRAQERVDKSGMKETLYGWADLAASSVKREGLALVPDTERHANIRGWPADKEERRFKQQQLAMVRDELLGLA